MQKMQMRGAFSRAERAREVLSGYPKSEPFECREEIERYLAADEIACLLCGKPYKMLALHLKRIHQIDAGDYRWRYNIPAHFGLVGKSTSQKKQCNSSAPDRIVFIKALGKTSGGAKAVPGRKCKMVLDEMSISMRQRSGRMLALVEHRHGGLPRYNDWSWHLDQVRENFYYTHIAPPVGHASWSGFKKRRMANAGINAEFKKARKKWEKNGHD